MYLYVYIYINEPRERNIHLKKRGALTTPRWNLYEYCALTQKICGFENDVVGSYGSEGVFLTLSSLQIGTFLLELW